MKAIFELISVLCLAFSVEGSDPSRVLITCGDGRPAGLGWSVTVEPDGSGAIVYYFDPTRIGSGEFEAGTLDFDRILESALEALEEDRQIAESQTAEERKERLREFREGPNLRVHVRWEDGRDDRSCYIEDLSFWDEIIRQIDGHCELTPSDGVTGDELEELWERIYFGDQSAPDPVPDGAEANGLIAEPIPGGRDNSYFSGDERDVSTVVSDSAVGNKSLGLFLVGGSALLVVFGLCIWKVRR